MRVLIVAPGSYGDVHPFLGLGKAMRGRGHDVTLMASGYFSRHAERAGLDMVELYSNEEYLQWSNNPDVANRWKAMRLAVDYTTGLIPDVYESIEERYIPGETLVVAPGWAFGARIAQEKLGVPLATVFLQPRFLRSIHDCQGLPVHSVSVSRFVQRTVDRVIDRTLGPGINSFRADLGLRPVSGIVWRWWCSPDSVIGFFPDWYSRPQPDWPSNTLLAGFPLYDEGDVMPLDEDLEAFLSEGEAPLVFSHSSWMRYAHDYLQVAVEVAQKLKRRAILLSPYAEHLPKNLPDGVRHFGFIPFSQVLPRTAAHIHHGGIGTIGLTLAAGIPQLTVPQAHDQPDNSRRLARLGVSAQIRPDKFRSRVAAQKLEMLLSSPQVAERCRDYATLCRERSSLDIACRSLERLTAGAMVPAGV